MIERTLDTPGGPWKVATREETCDPEKLRSDLAERLKGSAVRFDDLARSVYSTDASIYQVEPLGVVIPKDDRDVRALVEVCREHGASITGRGAGTSLAGQTCGHGVVVDFSQHFDKILAVDPDKQTVRLQPGVVLDRLNAELESSGLFFGPDVATSSRATLGGMVNNNSSGARSILYGMTIRHVQRVRGILADGTPLNWGPLPREVLRRKREESGREGRLLDGLCKILEKYRDEIKERFPKVLRKVGGYPLDHLLAEYDTLPSDRAATFNPAKIFCGGEGTLGLLTELTLDLVPLRRQKGMILLEFESVAEALLSLPALVALEPSAVELLDHNILGQAKTSPGLKEDVKVFKGDPKAILITEFLGENAEEFRARVRERYDTLLKDFPGVRASLLEDLDDQNKVWNIRKAGLGMMMRMKGHGKPCAFIEDAAIPIADLPKYVDELFGFFSDRGLAAGAYAHASVGLLHIRPILDLYSEEGVGHLREVAEKSVELSLKYGGSFSGEHGDGFARSEFLPTTHGTKISEAFREVKQLFDPEGILNPGKIVAPYPMDRNLRYGAGYVGKSVETVFDYSEHGSFSDAVDMCSGVGQCRNLDVGTMCPSYMATHDEFHTTRARASAFRDALNGRIKPSAPDDPTWVTDEIVEALDLCLSCKACKTECPTGVDMARWKGEALEAHAAIHGRSFATRMIADYPRYASLGSRFAPLINIIAQNRIVRGLMESRFGLDRRVPPPVFHRDTFRKWFAGFQRSSQYLDSESIPEKKRVVFFVDTYTDANHPSAGIAAIRVLLAAGFHPLVLENTDEGRACFSKGFLEEGRKRIEHNLNVLRPAVEEGRPVIGIEPSSILTFRDESPNLFDTNTAKSLAENSFTLAEFLDREIAEGRSSPNFKPIGKPTEPILFHAHCHAKALADYRAPLRLLDRVPGVEASLIDAGCCGMAGSFGHEKTHYEVAKKVGEERLFPAIRKAGPGTRIVTEGFSCRHQVGHHLPDAHPVHYAEVLAESLADDEAGGR